MAEPYCIASVSWGKDSLAMLHMLIDNDMPLDEVVFFDTGMEFDAIYAERDRMLPTLRELGIEYTELKPKEPFLFKMFVHPVRSRETGEIHKYGYGWCGGSCRWGTSEKTAALDRYAESKGAIVYVGIAADETKRLEKPRKPYKHHPLAAWDMTESDCLEYCKAYGATWEQDGVCLYGILDRVSCWCCRNKNQKELRAIHDYLPRYWQYLKALESRLGTMKTKPLDQIGGDKKQQEQAPVSTLGQAFVRNMPSLKREKEACNA